MWGRFWFCEYGTHGHGARIQYAIDASNDLAFFSNAFDLGIVLGSIGLSWLAIYSYGLFWLAVALANVLGLLLYLRHNPEKQEKIKAQV